VKGDHVTGWRWLLGITAVLFVADLALLSTTDVTPLWWVGFALFLVSIVFYVVAVVGFLAERARRRPGSS
jgi:hypothetical protein